MKARNTDPAPPLKFDENGQKKSFQNQMQKTAQTNELIPQYSVKEPSLP
jgi:hypothetical protein